MRSTTTMTIVFILALIAIMFTTTTSAQEIKKSFDFRTLLTVETDHFVLNRAVEDKTGALIMETQPFRQLYIATQNNTDTLIARTWLNNTDTNQVTEKASLTITFDPTKNNTGTILLENDKKYLDFSFIMANHVAISTGIIETTGEAYQWVIPTHDSWSFTIFAKDGQIKETFIAKKLHVEVAKTFIQQYGSYILMFGLMGLNMWVQTKTKAMQERQAQEAARQAAGTADAAAIAAAGSDDFVDGGKAPQNAPAPKKSKKD